MAGRGMGCATKGGGAVESGPKNRTISSPSTKTGVPMMAKGGVVNQHKLMAMGKGPSKMMGGGIMRGYQKGGKVAKKMRKGGCA